MQTKVCSKCKKELCLAQFNKKKKRVDGSYRLQSLCKSCQCEVGKKHYRANKAAYIARARKHDAKFEAQFGEWWKKYKSKLSCKICGESHPDCLQFHHTSPENKIGCVSELIARRFSKAKIMEEVAKCIVLCANCHFKLHAKKRNNSPPENTEQ